MCPVITRRLHSGKALTRLFHLSHSSIVAIHVVTTRCVVFSKSIRQGRTSDMSYGWHVGLYRKLTQTDMSDLQSSSVPVWCSCWTLHIVLLLYEWVFWRNADTEMGGLDYIPLNRSVLVWGGIGWHQITNGNRPLLARPVSWLTVNSFILYLDTP